MLPPQGEPNVTLARRNGHGENPMGLVHEAYINSTRAREALKGPASSRALLKAIGPDDRGHGSRVGLPDGSEWFFHATSALTADDVLVVAPNVGTGRWLRAPGFAYLELPFTFATADAAPLLVVPAGAKLQLIDPSWKVGTSLTGGAASAIGLSSNKTGFTAKGALLGGATGDVAATLVAAATNTMGTIGSAWDTLAKQRVIWEPTENVRFDRITSVFTAGAGNACIAANILVNAGA
jgi:hypothetical protein